MFGNFSIPEMLIIMVIVLLLFGAKRIPEIAGGLGKGLREFKRSMNDAQREITAPPATTPAPPRLTDDELAQRQQVSGGEQPEPKRLLS
jgi:sec-independent protein translocase protein TatA